MSIQNAKQVLIKQIFKNIDCTNTDELKKILDAIDIFEREVYLQGCEDTAEYDIRGND